MDLKNMGGLVGGLIVAVILLAAVMIPITSSAQLTVGDEVKYTNQTSILLRPAEPGDVLEANYDSTDGWIWTLNDEVITGVGDNSILWNTYLVSDAAYLSGRGVTDSWASTLSIFTINPTETSGFGNKSYAETPAKVTFGDGTMTFTGPNGGMFDGSTGATIDYTWAYVVCSESDATYCAAVAGGVAYVNDKDDVVLCGVYTTGENDCAYTYKDGVSNVIGGDYTITVNNALELVDGTTDIYQDTVSVNIGEESFTPYRIIVPYEVSGHESGGAMYEMLGIIPLLVTVGIIIGIVGMMFSRRE